MTGRRQLAASARGRSTRVRAAAVLAVLAVATGVAVVGLRWLTSGLVAAAGRSGTTLDEAVGLAAIVGCWLCVGWFVLALTCTVAAAAPGAAGRCCAAAATLIAPWTMRRIVVAGLGLTVLTGPAVSAQSAYDQSTPMSAAGSPLDRLASLRQPRERPPLDRPADAANVVTVRAGDCLWTIAAGHLQPLATDAEIAAAWPQWYAANRAVIGPDPDFLLPGQQLVAPR